jgi:hypothetical protein
MGPHPIVVPRIDLLCRLYLWREMMVARPWERNAARLSSRFWLSKIDTISHSWLDSVTDCFPCGRMCFGLVFVNLAECYEMKRASFSLVCADNRRQRPAQTQPNYRRGRCRVLLGQAIAQGLFLLSGYCIVLHGNATSDNTTQSYARARNGVNWVAFRGECVMNSMFIVV